MFKLLVAAIFLFSSLSPLQAFHEGSWQPPPHLIKEEDDQGENKLDEVQQPLAYLQQHENDGVHFNPQLTDAEIMEKYKNIKDNYIDLKNGSNPDEKIQQKGKFFGPIKQFIDMILQFFNPMKGLVDIGKTLGGIGLEIGKLIEKEIERRDSIRGTLKGLAYKMYFDMNQACNILFFNSGHWKNNYLTNIVYQTKFRLGRDTFDVYVCGGGMFRNNHVDPFKGWPNLAAAGNYELKGWTKNEVHFGHRSECKAGNI